MLKCTPIKRNLFDQEHLLPSSSAISDVSRQLVNGNRHSLAESENINNNNVESSKTKESKSCEVSSAVNDHCPVKFDAMLQSSADSAQKFIKNVQKLDAKQSVVFSENDILSLSHSSGSYISTTSANTHETTNSAKVSLKPMLTVKSNSVCDNIRGIMLPVNSASANKLKLLSRRSLDDSTSGCAGNSVLSGTMKVKDELLQNSSVVSILGLDSTVKLEREDNFPSIGSTKAQQSCTNNLSQNSISKSAVSDINFHSKQTALEPSNTYSDLEKYLGPQNVCSQPSRETTLNDIISNSKVESFNSNPIVNSESENPPIILANSEMRRTTILQNTLIQEKNNQGLSFSSIPKQSSIEDSKYTQGYTNDAKIDNTNAFQIQNQTYVNEFSDSATKVSNCTLNAEQINAHIGVSLSQNHTQQNFNEKAPILRQVDAYQGMPVNTDVHMKPIMTNETVESSLSHYESQQAPQPLQSQVASQARSIVEYQTQVGTSTEQGQCISNSAQYGNQTSISYDNAVVNNKIVTQPTAEANLKVLASFGNPSSTDEIRVQRGTNDMRSSANHYKYSCDNSDIQGNSVPSIAATSEYSIQTATELVQITPNQILPSSEGYRKLSTAETCSSNDISKINSISENYAQSNIMESHNIADKIQSSEKCSNSSNSSLQVQNVTNTYLQQTSEQYHNSSSSNVAIANQLVESSQAQIPTHISQDSNQVVVQQIPSNFQTQASDSVVQLQSISTQLIAQQPLPIQRQVPDSSFQIQQLQPSVGGQLLNCSQETRNILIQPMQSTSESSLENMTGAQFSNSNHIQPLQNQILSNDLQQVSSSKMEVQDHNRILLQAQPVTYEVKATANEQAQQLQPQMINRSSDNYISQQSTSGVQVQQISGEIQDMQGNNTIQIITAAIPRSQGVCNSMQILQSDIAPQQLDSKLAYMPNQISSTISVDSSNAVQQSSHLSVQPLTSSNKTILSSTFTDNSISFSNNVSSDVVMQMQPGNKPQEVALQGSYEQQNLQHESGNLIQQSLPVNVQAANPANNSEQLHKFANDSLKSSVLVGECDPLLSQVSTPIDKNATVWHSNSHAQTLGNLQDNPPNGACLPDSYLFVQDGYVDNNR